MTAIGLVGDYVQPHLFERLALSFSFSVDEVAQRRRKGAAVSAGTTGGGNSPLAVAAASGSSSPLAFNSPAFTNDAAVHDFSAHAGADSGADVKRKPVEKDMTAGAKKLAKVSAQETKGMKSLASFFGAKK